MLHSCHVIRLRKYDSQMHDDILSSSGLMWLCRTIHQGLMLLTLGRLQNLSQLVFLAKVYTHSCTANLSTIRAALDILLHKCERNEDDPVREKVGLTVNQPAPACVAVPSLDSTGAAVNCCCKSKSQASSLWRQRRRREWAAMYNLSVPKFAAVAFTLKVGR